MCTRKNMLYVIMLLYYTMINASNIGIMHLRLPRRPAVNILYYDKMIELANSNSPAGWTVLHNEAYDDSLTFGRLKTLGDGLDHKLTNLIDK